MSALFALSVITEGKDGDSVHKQSLSPCFSLWVVFLVAVFFNHRLVSRVVVSGESAAEDQKLRAAGREEDHINSTQSLPEWLCPKTGSGLVRSEAF